MKKVFLFFCCVAGGCFSLHAAGDSLSLDKQLAEVIVYASPSEQEDRRSQSFVPSDWASSSSGRTLPYLLENSPGLVTTSDDGLGVGYTSFRVRGTDPSRIAVTVNGVPLNESESQTVFWVNMTDMASSASSASVLRGAGDRMNGSGGLGAAVAIQTMPPTDSLNSLSKPLNVELAFNGGMYATFREMVRIGGAWKTQGGVWLASVRLSKVNSDGYIERAASDLFSYQGEIGWSSSSHPIRTTSVRLMAFGGKEKTYMAWYGATREQIDRNRRFNPAGLYLTAMGDTAYYDNQTDNYRQHHIQLHVNHRFNRHWSLSSTTHYTYGNGWYDMLDTSVQPSWQVIQKAMHNHFYGQILTAKFICEQVDVRFGAALNRYFGQHEGTFCSVAGDRLEQRGESESLYLGFGDKAEADAYADVLWRIWRTAVQQLSLSAGLQYRCVHYRIYGDNDESYQPINMDHTWLFFNPKASLHYTHGGHDLSFSFAMANREPARADFTGATDGVLPQAERLFDYELGYFFRGRNNDTRTRIGAYALGLNLYAMDYANQLLPTGDLNSVGAAVTRNVKDSYRLGAELSLEAEWTPWLSWQANLTASLNRWRNSTEWVQIGFSPAWVAKNSLSVHVSGFQADLQTQVVSSQYLDNTADAEAMLRPYTVTDLHLAYLLPLKRWPVGITLRCHLNNLFNAMYESNGGCSSWLDDSGRLEKAVWYYPQAGFNLHVGFTLTY